MRNAQGESVKDALVSLAMEDGWDIFSAGEEANRRIKEANALEAGKSITVYNRKGDGVTITKH